MSAKTERKELPINWRWVKLGEVCNFINGDAYKESDWDKTGIQIIRIQNLNNETKPFNYWPGDLKDRVCVNNGDLLLAWSGTPGTSFGAHIWKRGPGFLNQHIFLVQTKETLNKIWASYAINYVLQDLIKSAHGAVGLAHVTRRVIEALLIPLPPINEQIRIISVLGEKMLLVAKARTAAQARLEAAKALPAAFLRQVFPQSGQSLPAGWKWVKLGEVCEQDRQIVEPNTAEADSLTYFSLEHIESETGRILKAPIEQVEDVGKSTTFRFDERHVLYGKLRPYLNKVALPDTPGRCTTEMIPLICSNDIDRVLLAWVLRRRKTVEFAMQGKTGARMPRADMNNLLTLEIPLPPLAEQQRIAAILQEQMVAVERARATAETELETINALPAALLRRAFNGEL